MLAEKVIQRAIDILNESSTPVQWSKDELVRGLNEGRRVIAENRPEAGAVSVPYALLAGSRQGIPSDGSRFLKVEATLLHNRYEALPLGHSLFREEQVEDVQIVPLSDTRGLLIWRDLGEGGAGMACLVIREDRHLRYTEPVLYNAGYTTVAVTALDERRVVLFYDDRDAGGDGTLRMLEVQDEDVIVGPAEVLTSSNIAYPALVSLGNGVLVAAYSDTDNSDYGTAVVVRASNGHFQFGDALEFEEATSTYVALALLSSNRVVCAYRDEGNTNQGTAIVLTVAGLVLTAGTAVVFETGATTNIRATRLSFGNVLIAYTDVGNSSAGTACALSVATTTITAGTPVVFNNASTSDIAVCRLTQGKAAIGYRDVGNSDQGTAIIVSVAGTVVTANTEKVFETGNTAYVGVAEIGSGYLVAAYQDEDNSKQGTAVLLPWTGTTISLVGAVAFESDAAQGMVGCRLDETHVFLAYADDGNSDFLTGCVVQVVDDVITAGTPVEIDNADVSGTTRHLEVVALEPSLVVIAYRDASDSNRGKLVAASIAGTVPTPGTPAQFHATEVRYVSVGRLHAGAGVVVARDQASTADLVANAFTVAGTTITVGAQTIVDAGDITDMRVVGMSEAVALTTYLDSDDHNALKGRTLTVASNAVTANAETEIAAAKGAWNALVGLDENLALAVWQDLGSQGKLRAAVLYAPSTVVAAATSVLLTEEPASYTKVTAIDASHIVVSYRDEGDSNYVKALVIERWLGLLYTGTPQVLSTTSTLDAPIVALKEDRIVLGHRNSNGVATVFWLPGDVESAEVDMGDLDSLNRHQPGWKNAQPGDPDTFVFDPIKPKEWWVSPPCDRNVTKHVSLQHSRYPREIPVSTDPIPYSATLTDLDFSEDFFQMLVDYVCYRAYQKEDEIEVLAKAQTHFQAFQLGLQSGQAADAGADPKTRSFPFAQTGPKPEAVRT